MGETRTWEQILWDFLCAIYQAWEGDCAELVPRPGYPGQKLQDVYDLEGAPEFSDENAKQLFIDTVNAVLAHLALPGNTLTHGQHNQVTSLMQALLADLG